MSLIGFITHCCFQIYFRQVPPWIGFTVGVFLRQFQIVIASCITRKSLSSLPSSPALHFISLLVEFKMYIPWIRNRADTSKEQLCSSQVNKGKSGNWIFENYIFCVGEKECGRKIFGERKDTFLEEKKKEENIWRGKCHQGGTNNEQGKIWILFGWKKFSVKIFWGDNFFEWKFLLAKNFLGENFFGVKI